MERYFVKAPVSGWHEVDREHFERFIENIRKHASPPTMTKDELIKSRTKITTGRGNPPTTKERKCNDATYFNRIPKRSS